MQYPHPLIIVSSRTGNTLLLAHALQKAYPGCTLCTPESAPEDLASFNPVLLGFWCDRGMAPEPIKALAPRLKHKHIFAFATMGGEPDAPKSQEWMQKTSDALVAAGESNTLVGTFLAMGKVDPEVFRRVTEQIGYLSPEREARYRKAQHHPDEADCQALVAATRSLLMSDEES